MTLEEKLKNNKNYCGIEWLEKEAENGDADAQFELGYYYAFLSDNNAKYNYKNDGFKWMSKAAENGHKKAMYYLGYMYQYGFGSVKEDDEKYRYWTSKAEKYGADGFIKDQKTLIMFNEYKKGAGEGDPDAIIRLARCYGEDDANYAPLLEKAAAAGVGEACNLLGCYYSDEDKPYYDEKKAVEYFLKGEGKGHLGCEFKMIERYWQGKGVEKDVKKAVICCYDVLKSNSEFDVKMANFYLTEICSIEPQEDDVLADSDFAAYHLRDLMACDPNYAAGYEKASFEDSERAIAYYQSWYRQFGYKSCTERMVTMISMADQIVNCPWPSMVDSIIRNVYFK